MAYTISEPKTQRVSLTEAAMKSNLKKITEELDRELSDEERFELESKFEEELESERQNDPLTQEDFDAIDDLISRHSFLFR